MPATWDEKLEVMDAAEVNWGVSTILAIFFAASLISACFFGLGYSFGRGGTSNFAGSAPPYNALPPASASAVKQSISSGNSASIGAQGTVLTQPSTTRTPNPVAQPGSSTAHAMPAASHESAEHYMIQVGATDSRRDARKLVSRLRRRGFHAGIYESRHDKFFHVQIGPFATTEQAQTMRHHVIASGYRAILKHAS